jgi:hypothetical protein
VNENDTSLSDILVVKGTGEELVVSTVHRVAALECNDINVVGEGLTDFLWGAAREVADWEVEAGDLSAHVVSTTLGGNHQTTRVLDLGSSVALEALQRLVREELVGEFNGSNWAVTVLEEDGHTWLEVLVISVENDRKSHEGSVSKGHVSNNRVVCFLVHETGQRGETSVHDELNVAKLTRGCLELHIDLGHGGFHLVVGLGHQVNQGSSVWDLLGSLKRAVD